MRCDHVRRRSSTRALTARPRPAAGHVLRRRHRRARRAVGDDVRQLGGQGGVAARRGARPRARRQRCGSTCRRTGSARCSSAPPGRPGWWSSGRRRPGRRGVRPRGSPRWAAAGRRAAGARRARCCRSASGSPSRCPTASTTSASRCGRSRTRSSPYDPPADADPAYDLGGEHAHPRRAVERGRRRDLVTDGGRLLSVANPASPPGLATFAEPLARGGSLVLVAQADRERLEATYVAERATARFPA